MSIRIRLVIMCLVVALLPAVPLTFVVQSLLEKSFDVGLNDTIEEALRSGVNISRDHFDSVRREFQEDVARVSATLDRAAPDSSVALDALLFSRPRNSTIDGVITGTGASGDTIPETIDAILAPFARTDRFRQLGAQKTWHADTILPFDQLAFLLSDDRTLLLASWRGALLFYHQLDPFFLQQSGHMLESRQLFAKLRLTRSDLSQSFFRAFVIIYAICVILALAFALVMAERIALPIRRLVHAADAVAEGDWNYRLGVRAGGETGRLVRTFNGMVERLDEQRTRIADAERMAAWRDVARHLAHEIKNPLLPIRLTVEELRDRFTGENENDRKMLEESTRVIGEELDHLQRLVREFSEFARMPELNPQTESLQALVSDVSSLYPRIYTTIDDVRAPDPFPFDPDQMRRVLINLYDNVVSVGAERVAVLVERRNGTAVLHFGDNGPGMPEDVRAKAFDPYFTTRSEGTGLGLAVLRNIVVLHGGTVAVESAPDMGTIFVITLPLAGPPVEIDNEGE